MTVSVTRQELFALVEEREEEVRAFLDWADETERSWSMRLARRPDIRMASEAAELFPEDWWGIVVFSCFGSLKGTRVVAPHFQQPLPLMLAEEVLAQIDFPRASIGHHRIQQGLTGATIALAGASEKASLFQEALHSGLDFDGRFDRIWARRPRRWGRTTIFDVLLRAGALGIGGRQVLPTSAYLAGSTGPARGFHKVFGGAGASSERAEWAEAMLRAWTENWDEVSDRVGASWEGDPYTPGDFENALCIWQEPHAH